MPEKSDRELIQETHDAVLTMKAVVFGAEGDGGLINELKEVKLAVKEMTLKTSGGEVQVASILQDVLYLKPKVKEIDKELHDTGGICETLKNTSSQNKDNRALLKWALGIGTTLLLAILGFLLGHIGVG